jgi:hypothetical protein
VLVSPMVSVPTVRDVVSIVIVREAVMLKVRPTFDPAPPGTVGLLDQSAAVLQFPDASVFQVPSVASADNPEKGTAASATQRAISFLPMNLELRCPATFCEADDDAAERSILFISNMLLDRPS